MKRRNFFLSLLALIPGFAMRWKLEPVKPVERVCTDPRPRVFRVDLTEVDDWTFKLYEHACKTGRMPFGVVSAKA